MIPYYSTESRIAALQEAATRWLGTPFSGNSASIGVGVSCQFLASALYRETGFIVEDPPDVPMAHAQFSRASLLEPWVDSHGRFEPQAAGQIMVGDLLGFRLGKVVHHCGIVIGPGEFVHAIETIGVAISPLSDATWKSRLRRIWRPVE